jgi:glycosyltransferase involved in cell wall biosynthesis
MARGTDGKRQHSSSQVSSEETRKRIKLLDVELDSLPEELGDLEGYQALRALACLHGVPVGDVEVPLLPGTPYTATDLRRVILRRLAWPVLRHHLLDFTAIPPPSDAVDVEQLLETPHPPPAHADGKETPLVTVAVCTRDRTEDLRVCLDALVRLDYPDLDMLVVDNAPSDDATKLLVEDSYPRVRYVREPRPGLDWARNRAIAEARGEIVAYTDDDVVVDPGWVWALVGAFGDSQVMAVTGLVVPYELETEAQVLFERNGFGRGFVRRYWRIDVESGERSSRYLAAGRYGTGANMAFRRSVFEDVGYFDPALDVGTVTNGGGDLEMFFRVLKGGHLLVYEPTAVVRHRHRCEYSQLRTQLTNNGIGFYSYLVRTALAHRETRGGAIKLGLWWFWWWSLRRLAVSFIRPSRFPRDLVWAELWGSLVGLARYPKAQRHAARIASSDDEETVLPPTSSAAKNPEMSYEVTMGLRTIDLCQPLQSLNGLSDYNETRIFVSLDGRPIGCVHIANHHRMVSAARLREAIVVQLGSRLLRQDPKDGPDSIWASAWAALERRYLSASDGTAPQTAARLPDDVVVSVVVPTYDRPHDLRECLSSLSAQATERPLEIIVVDNHPASGLTAPVVEEFPGVTLVSEARPGRAYASNRGFAAARGEIIASIDDDMVAPPEWLEKLLSPFVHADVAVVTGNTLPLELETAAQRLFEEYGGFWRGVSRLEADGQWFGSFRRRAVPTWELGGTGNAAFRANILAHPQIGLMDEALGAGTPTGTGEDIYLFYKVLKVGYTITYEPSAYAWHKHRREMDALRAQIYGYHKGHVAYHLTTWLRDRDPRALITLAVLLPKYRLRHLAGYVKGRLLGRDYYPLGLILLEIRGNLAGPWALWQSRRRVEREGRNDPYPPNPRQSVIGSTSEVSR